MFVQDIQNTKRVVADVQDAQWILAGGEGAGEHDFTRLVGNILEKIIELPWIVGGCYVCDECVQIQMVHVAWKLFTTSSTTLTVYRLSRDLNDQRL